jgi:hypothetical protein
MNMAEFNHKEYAKQMRENCAKDYNGNIICSAELWEQIASIIENTTDAVPKSEVEKIFEELENRAFGFGACFVEMTRTTFDEIKKKYAEREG